ncbi:uncharacterized protein I206_105995 [Kwoniella pini CBS 10737]|uniref:Uncharacterized protein n=1 Tax=Kwoniella pini CBS 10737 TaxID=1296096 RepID=A0A1B9I104_9TREE|nr:uncharacterized protein I206_04818 [Kwoniella pini CBS 10737]OCF49131.1 hypothetical protein I206_04818 [Kwoniella pini CBS 10737]
MGINAVIPATVQFTVHTHQRQESFPQTEHNIPSSSRDHSQSTSTQSYANIVKHGNGFSMDQLRAESYGSLDLTDSPIEESRGSGPSRSKGKITRANGDSSYDEDEDEDEDENGEEEEEFGMEPEIPVTWKYMSRLYLLVPIITLLWMIGLILLVTFAWPPNKHEKEAGQKYPHPLLFKPFIIGIFASCTVQTIRVPIWVIVSWSKISQRRITFWSTTLHATIHELLRLCTLTLITISPISGFHSSYYLGLGWGSAEVTWGIVQGWEQIELYKEVMRPSSSPQLPTTDLEAQEVSGPKVNGNGKREGLSSVSERSDEDDSQAIYDESIDQQEGDEEDEEDLERKVEILERMRARRDLEDILGLPFPNIPFPLHLLWRLDTLLLNLGLTLLLSSFYFNSAPIYRHHSSIIMVRDGTMIPDTKPHKWLWQVWVLVALLHIIISLVWKNVGRVGIGAVTWGGLIVALGSVFAGLGCWGGLV